MARNCDDMASDFKQIGGLMAALASHDGEGIYADGRIKGLGNFTLGPRDASIDYEVICDRKQPLGRFGPGPCSNYVIRREGQGMAKHVLKKRTSVGNLHMLNLQLARDATRLWGCPPSVARGQFEGVRFAPGRPARGRAATCSSTGMCGTCPLSRTGCGPNGCR
jgi:hypothetical protein